MPDTSSIPTPTRAGTARTLLRLLPFVRPALPRIVLGMVAALLAGLVALGIPLVLQSLVDGPLASRDTSQVWPAISPSPCSACMSPM